MLLGRAFGVAKPVPTLAVEGNSILMQYASSTETVTYKISPPASGSKGEIGTITITDAVSGSPQGTITLTPVITSYQGGLYFESAQLLSSGSPALKLTFVNPMGTTHVTLTPFFDGNIASIGIVADLPSIYSISIGGWPAQLAGRDISVPYYSQAVHYFSSLGLFANAYFDPFNTSSTVFAGTGAAALSAYGANTAGKVLPFNDVLKIAVSTDIDNVFPSIDNPASPYMAQLAGKTMIDIRSGANFPIIANQLAALGEYGFNNCVAIVHSWQNRGYDNALPLHYPAEASLGGSTGIMQVRAATKSDSCLFGLHENYTDYYPNFPSYTAKDTMLHSNGSQILGWFNSTTGIQAYVSKPNLFVTHATAESPQIHSNYQTDATFIDVNSSTVPWYRTDADASAPGSNTFAAYRNGIVALWSYERSVLHGPVFGEGSNHWFWSGLLDGVEAQFGAESTPITDGTQAPLFVDFDLMRIHPLQINYGMGYYNRWLAGGTNNPTTTQLDAYRMQEVIFGHGAYLTEPVWTSVPLALQEEGLVSTVAKRYALQTPSRIAYDLNGIFGDASAAAVAGNFTIPRVSYPNGDEYFANSSTKTWIWAGLHLPQYGWAATGTNFLAYTAQVGTTIADYAATSNTLYANARNQIDIAQSVDLAAPQIVSVVQAGTKAVNIQMAWNVLNPDPTQNFTVFIHFVPLSNQSLLAGVGADQPLEPSSTWTYGERVLAPVSKFWLPPTMPDGQYSVRVGLYNGNLRATLWGNNDGTGRYIVGTLTVANNGTSISFTPVQVTLPAADPRLNSAGSLVDFGTVRTDGMVFLEGGTGNDAGTWTLRSFPRSRDVAIQFKSSFIAMPSTLTCDGGQTVQPTEMSDGVHWQVNLIGMKSCSFSGPENFTYN